MQLEMEFPRKRIDNLDLGNAENQVDLVKLDVRNFGTFSDSRTAPIHRWFQYPAGFSYRAVEFAIKNYGIKPGNLVFDPFVGTGTTSIVAKGLGIESYGIEAHKFVQKVAAVKTKWDYPAGKLQKEALKLFDKLPAGAAAEHINLSEVPELVQKCFSVTNLKNLVFIREEVKKTPEPYRSLFSLALTCTLRLASAAATGWPYISPKSKIKEKDGVKVFQEQLSLMIRDIETTPIQYRKTKTHILLGDARNSELQESMFDLSFTSPPYLNNYDYADRTRLETYFHQIAENWADITNKVRNKLIMSATTQISRTKYVVEKIVSEELISLDVRIAKEIQDKVNLLTKKRLEHTGKKSYDILVGQYFNDISRVVMDNYRLLKSGGRSIWIVGDSAPYGVHVPTDKYIAAIAKASGFRRAEIAQLRTRGDKWRGNTQRHHVALAESILILEK